MIEAAIKGDYVEVEAYIVGQFAVHPKLGKEAEEGTEWNITHVNTGLKVGNLWFAAEADAIEAAKLLDQMLDLRNVVSDDEGSYVYDGPEEELEVLKNVVPRIMRVVEDYVTGDIPF